jgi:hypothetical protein
MPPTYVQVIGPGVAGQQLPVPIEQQGGTGDALQGIALLMVFSTSVPGAELSGALPHRSCFTWS